MHHVPQGRRERPATSSTRAAWSERQPGQPPNGPGSRPDRAHRSASSAFSELGARSAVGARGRGWRRCSRRARRISGLRRPRPTRVALARIASVGHGPGALVDGALDPSRHPPRALDQPAELGHPLLGLILLGAERALGFCRAVADARDRLLGPREAPSIAATNVSMSLRSTRSRPNRR